MEFKKQKIEKIKPEEKVLRKLLGEDFDMVKKAFEDDETAWKKIQDHAVNDSWDANLAPKLKEEAKLRQKGKNEAKN